VNAPIHRLLAAAALLALVTPAPVAAADAFMIGITADITGPNGIDGGPTADALRIYFDRVNAQGGINGKPVKLDVRDNQSQGARAGADAKSYTSDDDIVLIVNASLSPTYEPIMTESRRAGMPVLFAGGVCPKEVFPPADPLMFCTSAFAAEKDTEFAVTYAHEASGGKAVLGMVSTAIPISRAGLEHGIQVAEKKGLKVVAHETIPPPTPNYAPFATKLKDSMMDWGVTWGPWSVQVRIFEAMRQLGWNGRFLLYGHSVSEDEVARLKDPGLLLFRTSSMFADGLPVHKDVMAAAEGKTKYPTTYMSEGWVAAQAIEAALKKVAWPPSRAKVTEAMNDIVIDTKGLRGQPIVWTKTNHFRTESSYRVYAWNAAENKPKVVKDWAKVEIK